MKITTTKELGRAGTACLPVPNTAEITTLWWKKSTLIRIKTHTNLKETGGLLEDIAMIPDRGFELTNLGANGIHRLATCCCNIARPNKAS